MNSLKTRLRLETVPSEAWKPLVGDAVRWGVDPDAFAHSSIRGIARGRVYAVEDVTAASIKVNNLWFSRALFVPA